MNQEEKELLIHSFKEIELSEVLKEAINEKESINSSDYIDGFLDIYSSCHYIKSADDTNGMVQFISTIGMLRHSINMKNELKNNDSYIAGFNDCLQMMAPILYISKIDVTDPQEFL